MDNQGAADEQELIEKLMGLFAGAGGGFGSLDYPTKDGFLFLAREGKSVWNTWRRNFTETAVSFHGHHFSSQDDIDFKEFDFCNANNASIVDFSSCIFNFDVDFSDAKFGKLNFSQAKFYGAVDFSRTHFSADADFTGTQFFQEAAFAECNFIDTASFESANFHRGSNFSRTKFTRNANFRYGKSGGKNLFRSTSFLLPAVFTGREFDEAIFDLSIFQDECRLERCIFSSSASFYDCLFKRESHFDSASFSGPTDFSGSTFSDSSFKETEFAAETKFLDCNFNEKMDFSTASESGKPSKSSLRAISFSGSRFKTDALFTNRFFLSTADFGRSKRSGQATRFYGIPEFHGCKFHQDTSFDDAEFLASPSQEAARAYRTLKLAMEQLKATREEQRFFRLEMKAEHPSLKRWRRLISSIYAMTSDYGFSLRRPLGALLCTAITIGLIHGGLANAEASKWQVMLPSADFDLDRTLQWLRYVAINTLPVPGFDKTQMELRDALFDKDGAIVSIAMGLEMIHKVISLGCVFLLGLALRNLFKMKS